MRFSLLSLACAIAVAAVVIQAAIQIWPRPAIELQHAMQGGCPTIISYAHGKQIVVTVPEDVGPKWKANDYNPPLSARQAIELAISKRESIINERKNHRWEFQHAMLCPADGKAGYWYWLVVFYEEFAGASSGVPPDLRLVVLMDGTVVEPEINDYP